MYQEFCVKIKQLYLLMNLPGSCVIYYLTSNILKQNYFVCVE